MINPELTQKAQEIVDNTILHAQIAAGLGIALIIVAVVLSITSIILYLIDRKYSNYTVVLDPVTIILYIFFIIMGTGIIYEGNKTLNNPVKSATESLKWHFLVNSELTNINKQIDELKELRKEKSKEITKALEESLK